MRPIGNFWYVPPNLPRGRWHGGELLAWRVWNLIRADDGGLRLTSVARNTIWNGPALTADYRPAPVADCASGIYALKPTTRVPRGQFDWVMGPDTWVRGWVALSGQVVEHRLGYRAECAVIRRLRLGPAAHRCFVSRLALLAVQLELERRYQCPVKITGIDARIATWFVSRKYLWPDPGQGPGGAPLAAAPPPAPRRRRTARPRGVSPDGIRYDAVRRVFAQAERALGTKWPLFGRGHCDRVTLKSHYSRHARLGARRSVMHFSPSGSLGRHWVFPLALVRRAASILKIDLEVLISRRW